jgi:hypothetical protein
MWRLRRADKARFVLIETNQRSKFMICRMLCREKPASTFAQHALNFAAHQCMKERETMPWSRLPKGV